MNYSAYLIFILCNFLEKLLQSYLLREEHTTNTSYYVDKQQVNKNVFVCLFDDYQLVKTSCWLQEKHY